MPINKELWGSIFTPPHMFDVHSEETDIHAKREDTLIISIIRKLEGNPQEYHQYNDYMKTGKWVELYGSIPNHFETGAYLDGAKVGEWVSYMYTLNSVGTILTMTPIEWCSYKAGYKDGEFRSIHPNGKNRTLCRYQDDYIDGLYIEFHANGRPKFRGYFQMGMKVGVWEKLDPIGTFHFALTYDKKGRLIMVEDAISKRAVLKYDESGELEYYADTNGDWYDKNLLTQTYVNVEEFINKNFKEIYDLHNFKRISFVKENVW